MALNPYDWQSHQPVVAIARPEVTQIARRLARGGSVVLFGGRGMGKSVFLGQLQAEIERLIGLRVLLVPGPPSILTVEACLGQLAEVLGVSGRGALSVRGLVDAYFDRGDVPERLVLLFDEFDRYAQSHGEASPNPPSRGFFNDLEITRRGRRALGILATGSIGVYAFRDVLGSSFLSRAEHRSLGPFDRATLSELAAPFAERAERLREDVIESLHLATGGVPALVTYGFEELWELDQAPDERHVTDVFVRFQELNRGYLDDVRRSFSHPRLSRAPQRILDLIQRSPGEISRQVLAAACEEPEHDGLGLSLVDALDLLRAAGLIRVEGSISTDNPVRARPIPSLLTLPSEAPAARTLGEQLVDDLTLLLGKLHRSAADFFRPAPRGKRLVPESVFTAHLALGLELLGWRGEREAQSGAGRTDLKLRRNGDEEMAVVEVKIWGRPGAREAQRQVESYWTAGVVAGAVVQLTDAGGDGLPEAYRRECLDRPGLEVEEVSLGETPLLARFACKSRTADGLEASVDHLLLRLPRRS
jgi:hypothetical protein